MLISTLQILLFRRSLDRKRFLAPSSGETYRRTLGVLSCVWYVFLHFSTSPTQTLRHRYASRILMQLGEQSHECRHLRAHISLREYLYAHLTVMSSKRRAALDSTSSWQRDLARFPQIHTTRSHLTVQKSFDTHLLSSRSVCPSSGQSS